MFQRLLGKKTSIDISQVALEKKLDLFLSNLAAKEELPPWAYSGLCNAYSFMRMRADSVGETNVFFNRLERLAQASDTEIKRWSSIYKTHQLCSQDLSHSLRTELTATLENKEDIAKAMENEIDKQTLQLQHCDKETLDFVKNLYFFIHSLLASFNAIKYLGIEEATQESWNWLLYHFLPPDGFQLISEVMSLAFVFTKTELTDVLKKAFMEGDMIGLNNTTHAMYSTKNTNYELYDPNNKDRSDRTKKAIPSCSALTEKISQNFFTNFDIKSDWMPITLRFFEKSESSHSNRPTAMEIIDNIITKRKTAYLQQHKLSEQDWNEISIHDKPRLAEALDLNTRGHCDVTSLYLLIKSNQLEIAKQILSLGADPNIPDDNSITPLFLASKMRNTAAIKLLLENGADATLADKKGWSPLKTAIYARDFNLASCLLISPIPPNRTDTDGATPLMYAIQMESSYELIELLLKNGAAIESQIEGEMSALSFAEMLGRPDIVNLIQTYQHKTPQTDNFSITESEIKNNSSGSTASIIKSIPSSSEAKIVKSKTPTALDSSADKIMPTIPVLSTSPTLHPIQQKDNDKHSYQSFKK